MTGIVIIAIAVLAYALVSERLKETIVTPPMAFAAFGLLISSFGIQGFELSHGPIHVLAEITLILILFSDAARIDLRLLFRDHDLPLRMLLIGMPLTILLGTLVAMALPLGLNWMEAALLAAVLAPTDAALGQSVVSNPNVPVRIRQTLNVESGLNDGLAVPFVFLFAALAVGGDGGVHHVTFTLQQIILGPLIGAAVGWFAAKLMDRAARTGWLTETFEGPAVLATVGLAYASAELVHGNGFMSAFVAGLVFGYAVGRRCKFILDFAEAEGQTLALAAFLVFGVAMLPEIAGHVSWQMVLYAILSLTAIRMIPIALSLMGSGVGGVTMAFLGWFGPRGLATVLFSLIVLEKLKSPGAETILIIAILTVAISIVAHGVTAAPFARLYGRKVTSKGACAENEIVSEMPMLHG
jgi:NhaP-type Na+/H+ or K+/H+ antiporter